MKGSSLNETVTTYVSRLVVALLTVISNVIIARLLGPEGKGVIALAFGWPFLVAAMILLGMETGMIYFTSLNRGALRHHVALSLAYAGCVGSAAGFAFAWIAWSMNLFKGYPVLLTVLSGIMVPVYVATVLVTAAFIGGGRLILVNSVLVITWTGYILLLVILWLAKLYSPSVILTAYIGLQVLSLFILVSYSHIKHWFNSSSYSPPLRKLEIMRYSLKTYPGSLAGALQLTVLIIVLGLVSSEGEVGLYSVANSVLSAICLLPVVVSTVLLPQLASCDDGEKSITTNMASRISFAATAAFAVITGIASIFLIPVLFGQAFSGAVVVTLITLPSAVAYSVNKALTAYFNGINKPALPSLATLCGFGFLVGVCLVFGGRWGAMGAAVAMSVSSIVVSLVLLGAYSKIAKTSAWNAVILRRSDARLMWNAFSPRGLFRGIGGKQIESPQPAGSVVLPPPD